jgi:hypothetical protein
MFGKIMRLDGKRQNRVDPGAFMGMFSPEAQKTIREMDTRVHDGTKLNSSLNPNPHEPTIVRSSTYPSYLDYTFVRTLYWNISIHGRIPKLARVFWNNDNSVVFEFEEKVTDEVKDDLHELLISLGHPEFTNPEMSGKRIGFDIENASYTAPRGDDGE